MAGRHAVTFNSADIGQASQGFTLDFQFKHEAINESDLYGLTTTDLVLRGCDVHLSATLKEYKSANKAIFWPLGGGTIGKIFTSSKPAGLLASDQALALVMTAQANTPAATDPATLTASKAWIAENYNPQILFDSRLRQTPIRLILLPYASSTDTICFSTT